MPSFRRVLVSATFATITLAAAAAGANAVQAQTSTPEQFSTSTTVHADGLFWPSRSGRP